MGRVAPVLQQSRLFKYGGSSTNGADEAFAVRLILEKFDYPGILHHARIAGAAGEHYQVVFIVNNLIQRDFRAHENAGAPAHKQFILAGGDGAINTCAPEQIDWPDGLHFLESLVNNNQGCLGLLHKSG